MGSSRELLLLLETSSSHGISTERERAQDSDQSEDGKSAQRAHLHAATAKKSKQPTRHVLPGVVWGSLEGTTAAARALVPARCSVATNERERAQDFDQSEDSKRAQRASLHAATAKKSNQQILQHAQPNVVWGSSRELLLLLEPSSSHG